MKTLINLVTDLPSSNSISANVVQKDYSLLNEINIMGLKVITNNNQVAVDIPKVLTKLFSEKFINKLSAQKIGYIYIVYSDYQNQTEGDFEVTVGIKVEGKIDSAPDGASIMSIPVGPYSHFSITGETFDVISAAWGKIWQIWPVNNTKNIMAATINNITTNRPAGMTDEVWNILSDDKIKSNNTTRAYKVDYEVYPIELLTSTTAVPVAMDIFIGIK